MIKNKLTHTQLNVCEKEELPCFLYLIQIFDDHKKFLEQFVVFISSFLFLFFSLSLFKSFKSLKKSCYNLIF